MRWQPDAPRCAECGFDWECSRAQAAALVTAGPDEAARILAALPDPARRDGETWSASMYAWHLADVLRIGAERLLTLACDPGRGITCWDENALAQVRRYQWLSPDVGLIVLRSAAREWADAAAAAPDRASVRHPGFGDLGAADLIRRNAHEMHHHLMDLRRAGQPEPGTPGPAAASRPDREDAP